ncbi:MAG: cation:proton antiporter [Candidatus Bilamarchaeum sp.]
MQSTIVTDFVWVVFFSSLAGLVSSRFNVPHVAALLFAGLLLGPNFLNLVDVNTITAFADIGAVLLLFLIGVEFNLSKLFSIGLRAVVISFLIVLVTFLIMHEVALLIGFDSLSSLFVGAMFSLSSTAIMIKILEQKGLVGREEVPTLVAMLVIEDIIAVFMLTIFSNLHRDSVAAGDFLNSFIIAFAVLLFAYLLLLKLLKVFSDLFLKYSTTDTIVLFSFTLGVALSALASILGLSPAIGAFLAGSLTSALPRRNEIEHSMRSFSLVFSSFFFASVGMLISPSSISAIVLPTSILVITFMVTVFLATAVSFFLLTSNGRSSVFAGLVMLPLGEFSLLIAKESVGLISSDLVAIASIGVFISSWFCSIAVDKRNNIFNVMRKSIPERVVSTLQGSSSYFSGVIQSFEPGGYFHRLLIFQLKRVISDVLMLIGGMLFYWLSLSYLTFQITLFGRLVSSSQIVFFIVGLLCMVPVYRVIMSFKRLFNALSTIISRTTPVASKGAIFRNFIVAFVFFIIFTNFYLIVNFLQLPAIFNWISVLFALLCVFFFWSAIRAVSLGLFLSGKSSNTANGSVPVADNDLIVVGSSKSKSHRGSLSSARRPLTSEDIDQMLRRLE